LSDKRKYRKFTVQQKAELVLASFRGDRSIAEICREHDISETLLRRWRDQMVEAGMERFGAGQDRSLAAEQRRRIAQLERTLAKKTYELEISGSSCECHERRLAVVPASALVGVRRLKGAARGVRGDRLGDAPRGVVRGRCRWPAAW
jgi:transposase